MRGIGCSLKSSLRSPTCGHEIWSNCRPIGSDAPVASGLSNQLSAPSRLTRCAARLGVAHGVVYEAGELDGPPGGSEGLASSVAADNKTFVRFMREADRWPGLAPECGPRLRMGVKEQTPYYAMEYVEGKPWRRSWRGCGRRRERKRRRRTCCQLSKLSGGTADRDCFHERGRTRSGDRGGFSGFDPKGPLKRTNQHHLLRKLADASPAWPMVPSTPIRRA